MDLSALPRAAHLAAANEAASEAIGEVTGEAPGSTRHWRPGLGMGQQAFHSELFAAGSEASGAGLALGLALEWLHLAEADRLEQRGVLWVQDRAAIRLAGRPYRAGLPQTLRHRLIHVAAREAADALFALEEGVRCRDLAFVLGEIAGNPRALDFTASRRLSLAAEKHGVPVFLVRLDARPDLSSARMRWQVAAAPSPPPLWNRAAPGRPSWHAELFRARRHPPGAWLLHKTDGRLDMAGTLPEQSDVAPVLEPAAGRA